MEWKKHPTQLVILGEFAHNQAQHRSICTNKNMLRDFCSLQDMARRQWAQQFAGA